MDWNPQIPRLIILPGLNGTDSLFKVVLPVIPENVDLKIIPYPEEGLATFADHCEYVTKQIPVDKPYILLAESFSGPIALHALSSLKQLPAGLVLSATFIECPRRLLVKMSHSLPSWLMLQLFKQRQIGHRFLIGLDAPLELKNILSQEIETVPITTVANRLRALTSMPNWDGTCFSELPVCYLQAKQDLLVPHSSANKIKQYFPNIQTHTFNTPHCLLQRAPLEAFRVICDFTNQF